MGVLPGDFGGKVGGRCKCQIEAEGHGLRCEFALLPACASPEMPEIGQTALRQTIRFQMRGKR